MPSTPDPMRPAPVDLFVVSRRTWLGRLSAGGMAILFVMGLGGDIANVRRALGQEQSAVDAKALANALTEIRGDEQSWFRGAVVLAHCVELGIPEERFWSAYPGLKPESFPPVVLKTLRAGTAGLPDWARCLDDDRPTGIAESDLFGGGSSKNARKWTCRELAAGVIGSLIPAADLPKGFEDEKVRTNRIAEAEYQHSFAPLEPQLAPEQRSAFRKALAEAAGRWEQRLRKLEPEARMHTWFAAADDDQRSVFLALAMQMEYARAVPLLEARFREQAKTLQEGFLLEMTSYARHRRSGAKALVAELAPIIRRQSPPEQLQLYEFYLDVWTALARYDSLAAAIEAQPADKLDENELRFVLEVSFERPWAYREAQLETFSASLRRTERSLQDLIAAAAQTERLERRLTLLKLAEEAAELLEETWAHVSKSEKPVLRSDAPERRTMIRHLRELFRDRRIAFSEARIVSPAEKAAAIVWELWHPSEQEGAGGLTAGQLSEFSGYRHDWRTDAMSMQAGSARSTIIDLAEYVLARPEGVRMEYFPEADAAKLAGEFTEGSAAEWRKKIEPLAWERKLLLHAVVDEDRKVAARFWPRYVELVDWTGPEEGEPASFAALWRDKLAGRKLDETTWGALQTWLTAEAAAGRYWAILGESYPMKPGVSLFVAPTHVFPYPDEKGPSLECELHGPYQNMGSSEYFRLVGDRREPDQTMAINTDLPAPMAALQKQLEKAAMNGDNFCRNGFRCALIVRPPSKK